MTTKFSIRPAVKADTPLLTALERAAFGEQGWGEAGLAGGFDAAGVELLLGGCDAASPTGFAIWRTLPGEAELLSVGVAPEARRIGLGAALLAAVIEAARQVEAGAIHLEVDAGNSAARALYGVAGFVETGLRKAYYKSGADAVLMCKRL